jgi:hypothetical protein
MQLSHSKVAANKQQTRSNNSCKLVAILAPIVAENPKNLQFRGKVPGKFADKLPDIVAVIFPDKIAAMFVEIFQLRLQKIANFSCRNIFGDGRVNKTGKIAYFSSGKIPA